MNFGFSGIWSHLPSTLAGIVAILVAVGIISQEQALALTASLPQIFSAITAIAGLIALFYKGRTPQVPPNQPSGGK